MVLLLAACGDDGTSVRDLDASIPLDDASPGRPANPSDAQLAPSTDPDKFSIRLTRSSSMFSSAFELEIDQAGQVRSRACGAQGPVSTTSTSVAQARELYVAILDARYWTLAERYQEEGEHCPLRATDFGTSSWHVEADGVSKNVERYDGCLQAIDTENSTLVAIPELVALDALVPRLQNLVTGDAGASACF